MMRTRDDDDDGKQDGIAGEVRRNHQHLQRQAAVRLDAAAAGQVRRRRQQEQAPAQDARRRPPPPPPLAPLARRRRAAHLVRQQQPARRQRAAGHAVAATPRQPPVSANVAVPHAAQRTLARPVHRPAAHASTGACISQPHIGQAVTEIPNRQIYFYF